MSFHRNTSRHVNLCPINCPKVKDVSYHNQNWEEDGFMRRTNFRLVTRHSRDDVTKLTCTLSRRRPASTPVRGKILGESSPQLPEQSARASETSERIWRIFKSRTNRQRETDRAQPAERHFTGVLASLLSNVSWCTGTACAVSPQRQADEGKRSIFNS